MDDAKPADSGSENKQAAEPASAGDVIPKPQLSSVAHGVAREMVGLVQVPEVLNLAATRLAAAHMREQETRISELRQDLAEAADRERGLRNEKEMLSVNLARNSQSLTDEHKLRAPRTAIISLGGLVFAVGGEQAATQHPLGWFLMALGLSIIIASQWLGSSKPQ